MDTQHGRWMQSVLDGAADGVIVELHERVVYANDSYARLLGYRRAGEILQRAIVDLIADGDAQRLINFGRMRTNGKPMPSSYDFAGRRKDGSTVRLNASVSVSMVGRDPYILTVVRLAAVQPQAASEAVSGPHDRLSKREREVMELILAGKRMKEIAFLLQVSEKTVSTHRARLLARLALADNRELFQYALRHRLVDWS